MGPNEKYTFNFFLNLDTSLFVFNATNKHELVTNFCVCFYFL